MVGFVSLFFQWTEPAGWDWAWLLLVGIFSQLGQIFLTNALQRERIAGVAIINYTGLVYALTLATNNLIKSGKYRQALARWGIEEEAVERSETNPPGLPKY